MPAHPASRATTAATVSLVVFAGCVFAFLPPLLSSTLESVPRIILLGIAMFVAFALHLVFIGIAAARLKRSAALWVLLALVTFPLASIVGLVLFTWFEDEPGLGGPTAA